MATVVTIQPVDPEELHRALEGSRFVAVARGDLFVICTTTDTPSTWADATEVGRLVAGVRQVEHVKDSGKMVSSPTPLSPEERAKLPPDTLRMPKQRGRGRR